jgi:hypothetical protein
MGPKLVKKGFIRTFGHWDLFGAYLLAAGREFGDWLLNVEDISK